MPALSQSVAEQRTIERFLRLPHPPRVSLLPPVVPKASLLESIKNGDARSFWKDMVGENVRTHTTITSTPIC
jgi:hypothetical protein